MSQSIHLHWRRKLHAFLHDSPNKVLDILDHENSARRIAAGEGFDADEHFRKESDWAASAADRLPWPKAKQCNTATVEFRHPLDGSRLPISTTPKGKAEEISQKTRPVLDDAHPRRAFLATWRFWRNWASSAQADFAHYPAETRLPDHTIWSHLAVTSALQGCFGGDPCKPAGALPLPGGLTDGFREHDGKFLVKWVLLTPAIWPEIPPGTSKRGTARKAHHGGWLPNWIDADSLQVLLQTVSPVERRRAAERCLGEFAKQRQVLFFTCHPDHARELEEFAGAKVPAIAG